MCGDTGRRVYLYPTEFITNGVGYTRDAENLGQVITKPNGTKEYRVSDHLASLRVAVEGANTRAMDYDPWGNIIAGNATGERSTFNDQERDLESGLYDLTDRNLDAAVGGFTRPDRLWEKFPAWSPYHYTYANPLRFTDPSGLQAEAINQVGRFLKGFFVDGPLGWIYAAADQAQFFFFAPLVVYNQGKDLFDGTTARTVEQFYTWLNTDNGAYAEFGGKLAFDFTFTHYISGRMGLLTGAPATAAEPSAADKLRQVAQSAREAVGEGKGPQYGTKVHTEFAKRAKALGIKNLRTEVSYKNGVEVKHGTPGSIRVDAVIGEAGKVPEAVYDLKTGGATLTVDRVKEIRSHLPAGSENVPILEVR